MISSLASTPVRAADSWTGPVVFYLLVATLVRFAGLGGTGLVGLEAMAASSAEDMLATGEYLIPELYGEAYTYKPPLFYWLVATSIWIFGVSEWAVRLPGALLSLATGLAVLWLIGRITRPRTGLFAALATTTSFLWMQKAGHGDFDVVLSSFAGIAVAAACHEFAVDRARSSPGIWLLAYLSLAAAFLVKGVPALMAFAPGLVGAAFLTRRTRRLTDLGHLIPVTLFGAIVGGYLLLLVRHGGATMLDQPLAEAQNRGLEWTLSTLGRTLTKPLRIAAAFLPWSLAWPWAFATAMRSKEPRSTRDRLALAAGGFLGCATLAFMAVPTHETRYYLPLGVAAAIASAIGLDRLAHPARRTVRLFLVLPLTVGTLTFALAFAPIIRGEVKIFLGVVGLLVLAAALSWRRVGRRDRMAYLLLLTALTAWVTESVALRGHRGRFRVLDRAATELAAELPAGTTVWAPGEADLVGKNGSLYFYLDRPVRTFHLGEALPPAGSHVLLTATEARRLEGSSPEQVARLELIRRVHDPWRLFLLYRVRLDREPAR